MLSMEEQRRAHLALSSRPFYNFTKVKALCVHWEFFDDEGSRSPTALSHEITFEKERYFFKCMFTDQSLRQSQLVLFAADGRPRRPRRPFHISVFVWGKTIEGQPWELIEKGDRYPVCYPVLDGTCSLLAQGTVSEVPWIPDYNQDFFSKHATTGTDSFAMYYTVKFLLVFESSSIKHDISQCVCPDSDDSESDNSFPESSRDGEKNRRKDEQPNASDNVERPIQKECAQGTSKVSEFPSNLENLSLDFSNLLKNETLTDVKLKCGGRDRAIPAHRSVLAARSEVFAAMFRNEMAESRSGDVDVVDVDDDVIDPFLQYVYSGKIPSGVSDDIVPRLYAAADKYAVHALRETCRDWMVRGLTEENCVTFLSVADAHCDAEFKKSVIDYICSHEMVLKGDAWREFAKKQSSLAIEVYDSFVERKTRAISLDDKPK